MIEQNYLGLKWTVSRGRETYGYNVLTLTDQATGKRYKCSGGGYDMTGTVFAQWLQDVYQSRLVDVAHRANRCIVEREATGWDVVPNYTDDTFYGMTFELHRDSGVSVRLDGACGLESIRKIAEAIGVNVRTTWNRKGHTTGFMITVDDAS